MPDIVTEELKSLSEIALGVGIENDIFFGKVSEALKRVYDEGYREGLNEDKPEPYRSDVNEFGCTPRADVCLRHSEPLICEHGCSEAHPHPCVSQDEHRHEENEEHHLTIQHHE